MCNCDGIVPCDCGIDCDCKKTSNKQSEKPVVFACKNFRYKCPGCIKLAATEDKLPVKLIWKPATSCVTSYPTLQWQGTGSKWYQYRWGQTADDVVVFNRNFTATKKVD